MRLPFLHGIACLGFTGVALGCQEPVSTAGETDPPNAAPYLTEAVRKHLDAQGRLNLPPAVSPNLSKAILSPESAQELALAFVRQFGEVYEKRIESAHDRDIDPGELAPARIYYAQTPYTPPPEDAHPMSDRLFGPYYIIILESDGQPVLSVAVSAYATDLRIERGSVVFPRYYGQEFVFHEIRDVPFPAPPEWAVERIGSAAGVLINRLPELVLPSRKNKPHLALWRIGLETPIELRAPNGAVYHTDELFVNAFGEILKSRDIESVSELYLTIDGELLTVQLPLREGYSLDYEAVAIQREAG